MSTPATVLPETSPGQPPMPPGTQMHGPSALGGSPARFFRLTWTLAVLEFRLKFFGSVLGYLWQLMKPLMLFAVLFFVFTQFVRLGSGVKYYPQILLMGIVLYNFFAEATAAAVRCVVAQEGLVRKIHFPRMVIPLSVVVTAALNLGLNLIAVAVFIFAAKIEMTWRWLEIFPLLILLFVVTLGISMLVAALYVRFRDVAPIWDVFSQALFYGTPIIYVTETIPSHQLQRVLMCNPLGFVVQQVRHSIFDHSAPSAFAIIGGVGWALIPIGLSFGLLALGFWVFNREAPRVAEDL